MSKRKNMKEYRHEIQRMLEFSNRREVHKIVYSFAYLLTMSPNRERILENMQILFGSSRNS